VALAGLLPFLAALLLAAVGVPFFRRLALVTGFVDQPNEKKVHDAPIPYLGGMALIGGVLAGLLVASRHGSEALLIALGAGFLGTVGLLDDDRTVEPRNRLLLELAIASLALFLGLRVSATGVPVLDVAVTLVWIVGITNAFNLLDNMDGLAGGVGAIAAAAVFVLAALADQELTVGVAAAVVGACLGFLVYNRPPARIFMGDTGSLFLGFSVAVLTIKVDPVLTPPASFAVPLILLALPVLDTATVTLARLRRGRRVSIGGRDHLSHRLVALGLSRPAAVGVLLATEALLAALALLAGRRVLPLAAAAAATASALAVLSVFTSRARVYEEDAVSWPRWLLPGVGAAAGGLLLLAGPATIALARAERPGRTGTDRAERALAAAAHGEPGRAAAEFRQASAEFAQARRRLRSPLTSLGLVVPGLSPNLSAARALVSTGERLAKKGSEVARLAEASQLSMPEGSIPPADLRRLAPSLADAAAVLEASSARLARVDEPYILPPLRRAIDGLEAVLQGQAPSAAAAAEGARLLPAVLGGDGPRHYFLGFQDNAELRGTGGFISHWGEVIAENGRMRLVRFGRLEELNDAGGGPRELIATPEFLDRYREFDVARSWQQVNVSPDFPTTARVIAELYPQSGGRSVDGVLAVDTAGLAALLALSGPVQVPGWPEPISAANVVEVAHRGVYGRFPGPDERTAFLGELRRRAFEAFTSADLGNPGRVIQALGEAVRGDHLMAYLDNGDEERLVRRVGADGAIPPVEGDALMVVNQNLSATKIDRYLRRRLRYVVTLDPASRPANLRGRLELTLDNRAPPEGLPGGATGAGDGRSAPGENRTYVSLYSPFEASSGTLDGEPLPLSVQPELGRLAQSATLSIPPMASRTLRLEVTGRVELTDDGWYRLDLGHQPLLLADDVEVSVVVAKGWRITDARGLQRTDRRRARGEFRLDGERSLWARVERADGPREVATANNIPKELLPYGSSR
jgi:UDP-GlcNAc:undecaprenyl-phosphate/decaprenyl-phosphate GlcNAc-1-phosphate transferase